jgi:hypothetical protein
MGKCDQHIINISGTQPQDVDERNIKTVLKEPTKVLTRKKGLTTYETAHKKCIR